MGVVSVRVDRELREKMLRYRERVTGRRRLGGLLRSG